MNQVKHQPAPPLRLRGGFGQVRNIVPVASGAVEVGEMHILRRSGWRGGPSYQFHPNAEGKARGLKVKSGTSARDLLRELGVVQVMRASTDSTHRLTFFGYWLTTLVACCAYGWFYDKTLEYTLAGPYWTGLTLLSVRYWLMRGRFE